MCVRNVLGRALALDAAAQGLAITKLTLYELPFNSGDQLAWAAAQHYSRELSALLSQGRRGDAVTLAMTTWGAPPQAVAGMRQTPIWPLFEAVAPTLAYDDAIMGDGTVPAQRLATISVPRWSWLGDRVLPSCKKPRERWHALSPTPASRSWRERRTRSPQRSLLPCWERS